MRFARQNGHACSIETNGRRFADRRFVAEIAKLGPAKIQFQVSLHSHVASLHDDITRIPGSFSETVAGIRNIADHGFGLIVNVVMTKNNVYSLGKLVSRLGRLKVKKVKFSMINFIERPFIHLVPSLSDMRSGIAAAEGEAKRQKISFFIEKAPLCVAPQHADKFLLYAKTIGNTNRVFARQCKGCLLVHSCEGLDHSYHSHFGSCELIAYT